jgi:serine/threonine protein kinase
MENTFGKYRIAAPIATKSSNPAYRARPVTATEWSYVVKIYNNHKLYSLAAQEEWQHNMAALMHLEHSYLLPIIETGIEEEVPYSVMKYMEGGSLRDRLNQIFPEQLVITDVKKIILQVGQALQYAHDNHILHGNIKPENILFNEHDDAVLIDFRMPQLADETDPGLPVAMDLMQEPDEAGDDRDTLQLTYYPALESLSEKSDQYALGCLAYELLTGRLQTAMLSSTLPSVYPLPKKKLTVASPSDQEWVRQIEMALRKAVEEEPEARYENVAAFLEAFEQACSFRSSIEPATSMFPENWPMATLMHLRNTAWQLPTLHVIKTYSWRRSDWLMQMYQAYKENAVWRWSAIIVPLVILVTFCLLLITRFSSSQPSWQAVATPTLQAANGTVVSITQQSEGFALRQQIPTPTPTAYVNAAPSVSSGSGSSTTSTSMPTATSSSGSGSHKSHKSHKSSHSSSSSSGSSSNSSSSGSSSSDSSSSGSGSSSSASPTPTPSPTPFPTPTPSPTPSYKPTPPGSTGSHCPWGYGCNSGGSNNGGKGGWGGWGW